MVSERAPQSRLNGPVQAPKRSAMVVSARTRIRPLVTAPAQVPSTKGVNRLAMPKRLPHAAEMRTASAAWARKTKEAPRSTIPISTRVKGTNRAWLSGTKAPGKLVNKPTITKISQTWFASQTGPMAVAIAVRWRVAVGPVASKSQTPPPKSAPPRIR